MAKEPKVEEFTFRDERRQIEQTLLVNCRGELVGMEIVFLSPRPLADYLNVQQIINPPVARAGDPPLPVRTGGPPRRPCGGK